MIERTGTIQKDIKTKKLCSSVMNEKWMEWILETYRDWCRIRMTWRVKSGMRNLVIGMMSAMNIVRSIRIYRKMRILVGKKDVAR